MSWIGESYWYLLRLCHLLQLEQYRSAPRGGRVLGLLHHDVSPTPLCLAEIACCVMPSEL